MKPAAFEYHAPDTLDEALGLLSEHGWDAKVLAGGQSLIPTMNFRLAQPSVLIDLNGIGELDFIEKAGTSLRIGAMTRQSAVERSPLVAEQAPLVTETMPHIAHSPIRNRGTVGGSLAHADPAAELPAVMVALKARLKILGGNGHRWVEAQDFFTGLFSTALQPDEILQEIALPEMPSQPGWAFDEVARRDGDFALVGAAASVETDLDGVCVASRLVFLSVGDGPVRAHQADKILVGKKPTPEVIAAAAHSAATRDVDPHGDIHASSEYRRHLSGVLTRRVLTRAFQRAQRETPGGN